LVLVVLDCTLAQTGGKSRTEICEPIGAYFAGGIENVSEVYETWAAWLGLAGVRRRWCKRVGKETE
jgi:hypothetical protein